MERSCYQVPIGYRFRPTDAELLVHYLNPKVLSVPFPASVIPELDVFQTDPWSIPGDLDEKRYFFGDHREMNKCRRAAGSGHWRHVGKDKLVVAPRSNRPIGVRRTLVFRSNKRVRGVKTRWFMHQFSLLGSGPAEVRDWAVYCLFQKKRRRVTSKVKDESKLRSCCSGVTDVEDSALLDQEASSAWLH